MGELRHMSNGAFWSPKISSPRRRNFAGSPDAATQVRKMTSSQHQLAAPAIGERNNSLMFASITP